ncbi:MULTISPECIES: hypothetical protein [Hwangdonia]|uniref:Uncharacterized protein n=1 Tax=Hwangdonia seohaensis TaxID=1240727 RepID=A0ABW3RFJ8_9FLAO|nr:hypothetical protein [Hwangdonia seohaensis]
MEAKPNFPFKTLIWAVFAVLAILMFRTELRQLITNTEEFSLFGVELKASEEKANKLNDSIQNFETTIAELSTQLISQQNKINDLDNLKAQLQKDLENCPDAQAASMKFNAQVTKIFNTNKDLKYKSDKLINTKILKGISYSVKLIVPSNMVNADVFVDGKQANIVSKSGIFITVSVVKKNSSHRFELKDGTKRCVTNQLITKNETELPMVCNS